MSNETPYASIEILGKVYRIKCPAEEMHSLQKAAEYLEEKMRLMRDTGVLSADRVILITALNIVDQLLTLERQKNNHSQTINQRLLDLHNKVEQALAEKIY